MKVENKTRLLIAGIVWSIAGFNILKIGIGAYGPYVTILHLVCSAAIFAFFWGMIFNRLVKKHTKRIEEYEQKQYFWHFFDLKSFLIMAFMMTFGILIRTLQLMPEMCIAIFYTGLGLALFLAGLKFGVQYLKFRKG